MKQGLALLLFGLLAACSGGQFNNQKQNQNQVSDNNIPEIDDNSFEYICENNDRKYLVLNGPEERMQGYPYNSAHLVVYRLNFSDQSLNWPDLNKDLCKTRAYYKKQSYGYFEMSWEVKTVNLTETTKQFSDRDTHNEWRKLNNNIVKKSGIDPENPGGNRLILIVSPQISDYNSSGGYSFMNIFETHKGAGVIAHEMGHAMGLEHSRAIEGGSNIIPFDDDPNDRYPCFDYYNEKRKSDCNTQQKQVLQDYGNVYSMMGMGSQSLEEFNLLYKKFFNWLDLNRNVPLVQSSGVYRFYAYDQGKKDQGYIGLRLKSGNGKYVYWLEHRTYGRYKNNTTRGVLINLEGYADNTKNYKFWKTTSYLLDMTPGSKTPGNGDWWGVDQTDSALVVGQSYIDHWGGFKITVLQTGGPKNAPEAWVDVEVEIL